MDNKNITYEFSARPYQDSSAPEISRWTFVSLPKEMSAEIRNNLKWLEEGWGRLKITAKIGASQWQTAIWFDRKQDTYLLPLKKEIRKRENIELDEVIKITVSPQLGAV